VGVCIQPCLWTAIRFVLSAQLPVVNYKHESYEKHEKLAQTQWLINARLPERLFFKPVRVGLALKCRIFVLRVESGGCVGPR
jgi:hypothetical protein